MHRFALNAAQIAIGAKTKVTNRPENIYLQNQKTETVFWVISYKTWVVILYYLQSNESLEESNKQLLISLNKNSHSKEEIILISLQLLSYY